MQSCNSLNRRRARPRERERRPSPLSTPSFPHLWRCFAGDMISSHSVLSIRYRMHGFSILAIQDRDGLDGNGQASAWMMALPLPSTTPPSKLAESGYRCPNKFRPVLHVKKLREAEPDPDDSQNQAATRLSLAPALQMANNTSRAVAAVQLRARKKEKATLLILRTQFQRS